MINPVVVSPLNTKLFDVLKLKENDRSNVPKAVKRSMYLMHHGSEQIAFTGLTCEQGSTATGVEEEILALCHILEVNLGATIHFRKDAEVMSVGALS